MAGLRPITSAGASRILASEWTCERLRECNCPGKECTSGFFLERASYRLAWRHSIKMQAAQPLPRVTRGPGRDYFSEARHCSRSLHSGMLAALRGGVSGGCYIICRSRCGSISRLYNSHGDAAWAQWLHKALEGHHIPKDFAGPLNACRTSAQNSTSRSFAIGRISPAEVLWPSDDCHARCFDGAARTMLEPFSR